MYKAFSCLIHKNRTVTWKFGIDSHDELIKLAGYKDDKSEAHELQFARVDIAPKNNDYINPEAVYIFKLDEEIKPSWWSDSYENKCWDAQEKWLEQLNKILVRKSIIHPFKITTPEITYEHIALVREWASVRASVWASVRASVLLSVGASVRDSVWDSVWNSVRDSVWNSVWDSVWDSVWNSVWNSVWASVRDSVWASVGASVRDSVWASVGASVRDSVWDSVWDSVRASVWDSVGAYYGSFFQLPRDAWKYTDTIKTDDYPFLPAVKLWEQGLVPSFDGKKWRLHGGKDAKVLWEGDFDVL